MSEQLRHHESSHEKQPHAEIEKLAAERLKHLEHSGERHRHHEASVEQAREQIRKVEQVKPQAEASPAAEHAPTGILTKEVNFRYTMMSLRQRMKPAARTFSKVIHNPVVETVSETVGQTVLRPSVSLGATTTAVLFTGFLYLYSRHYGFLLRGSEIWISLLVGGLIGLVIEMIYKLIRRSAR